eukprot:6539017-Alexandrium_andersonii.AAC.1
MSRAPVDEDRTAIREPGMSALASARALALASVCRPARRSPGRHARCALGARLMARPAPA